MTEQNGSQLRTVLNEAVRERNAAEDIFKEDTGADHVSVEPSPLGTKVELHYYDEERVTEV